MAKFYIEFNDHLTVMSKFTKMTKGRKMSDIIGNDVSTTGNPAKDDKYQTKRTITISFKK